MAVVPINGMESLLKELAASEWLLSQEENRTREVLESRLQQMFGSVLDSLEENRQLRGRLKSLIEQENQAACAHAEKVKDLLEKLQGIEPCLDAMSKELDALEKKLNEKAVLRKKNDALLQKLDRDMDLIRRSIQHHHPLSLESEKCIKAYQKQIDELMKAFLSSGTEEVFHTYQSYSMGYNSLPGDGGLCGTRGSGLYPIKMASPTHELQQANQILTAVMTRMANREANLAPLQVMVDRLAARYALCVEQKKRK